MSDECICDIATCEYCGSIYDVHEPPQSFAKAQADGAMQCFYLLLGIIEPLELNPEYSCPDMGFIIEQTLSRLEDRDLERLRDNGKRMFRKHRGKLNEALYKNAQDVES